MTAGKNGGEAKRFLVFCRFYLIDDFRGNFAPFEGDERFEFAFFTDGHSPGTEDTRKRFYAAYEANERSQELSAEDEDEIVTRCRYLRNIDREKAVRQAHAMAVSIAAKLDDFRPEAILSHVVDDYVTHVCSILAAKRGIRYVSYAFSYFPGHIQLIQGWDGTPFDLRDPSDEEVDNVHAEIGQRVFRQNYLQKGRYSRAVHLHMIGRYFIKRVAFTLKKYKERDPLNLHYTVTPFVADRQKLRDFPSKSLFDAEWRDDLKRLRKDNPDIPVVYLPLAFTPESTIDYWIDDRRPIDYEPLMLEVMETLSRSTIVIAKDHTHMQGIRKPAFYNALGGLERVINVPPEDFSNDVLEECNIVLLGGGSVGVEATIRGKPVASYAPDCYWFAHSGATPLDFGQLAEWPQQLRAAIERYRPKSEEENRAFIRACLASTVRPRGGQRIWPFIQPDDLERLLLAA